MDETGNGKRIHLEIIRILAVCLVVTNHTDVYFLYFSNTSHPLTYVVSLFVSVLCRINVPLFFMVSGALLLKKKEGIRELYKKRVVRIVIVLLLFSALQYIVSGLRVEKNADMGVADFFSRLYSGQVTDSYWFLYAYLAVLISLPFFRKMVWGMDEKEFHYLFLLKVLFDIVLRLVTIYTGHTVNVSVLLTADSAFYLFAGYYMEWIMDGEIYGRKGLSGAMAALGTGLVSASMVLVWLEYRMTGVYSQYCLGIFTPILTIIAYYMVKSFCGSHVLPERLQQVILTLGSIVFGIYLVEKLVRIQLLPLYLYLCDRTVGLVACFVYIAGTIVISAFYAGILKKIPVIEKLV